MKPLKNAQDYTTQNLTNLITRALLCGLIVSLRDFGDLANSRFELWKGRQIKKGIDFSHTQLDFLTRIKDYIITNTYLAHNDLQGLNDAYGDTNGFLMAKALFGERFATLLDS